MRPEEKLVQDVGPLPPTVMKALGEYCAAKCGGYEEKLKVRQRALEFAVALAGPHSPGYSASEIATKTELLSDRLYDYMTKDRPTEAVRGEAT